jgi:3-oxoacyl-(acyl-carrier-protein) synthase
VAGVGLLCPAGVGPEAASGGRPGPVPGFRARAYIQDRKSLKLMTRSVQLGVSAVNIALGEAAGWEDVPAARRGIFVGASPQPGDPDALRPALEAAQDADGRFDLGAFAVEGIPLIHPLWLVRGLSNNVIGFASAFNDLQGVNANWCDGVAGGWTALLEGVRAVAEGRAELAVAGGADALVEAETLLAGRPCGDGAAFLVLVPGTPGEGDTVVELAPSGFDADEAAMGYLGAATWPVAVARALLQVTP